MKRVRLHVKGLVQGVGFRPFVYSIAIKHNLKGFVLNSSKGVCVEIEGTAQDIENFLASFENLPPLARVDEVQKEFIPPKHSHTFVIKKSSKRSAKTTLILPDMAICDDCLKEMRDPKNRRFQYPFINCTNCGPRYSIIKDIPYDRALTSMKKFTMCKACQEEYENPLDRRYHAQPISCKECGPTLTFYTQKLTCKNEDALQEAAKSINDGKIIAIKGVGGFHLVCDGTNDLPIQKLRAFKNRPLKPFAIMCKDEQEASLHVKMTLAEKKTLISLEKPIVLMKKSPTSKLSNLVAPMTNRLGIFLPNTPLHVRLFDFLKAPIIATSANIKSEPIITDKKALDERFGDILSGILDYDRDIIHPSDDSLVQMIGDKKLFLRVSRGIVPLQLLYPSQKDKNILAVGAMDKNAIAFYSKGKITLSPYIGDMSSIKTFELFKKSIDEWKRFYGINFDVIIHDNHPNYLTTKWAKEQNIKTKGVNHHHAHILSVLLEKNLPLDKEVLGIAWDGTGYGDDGSIWGGEFLVCKGRAYKRVGYLKPFKLLGSEKSIKHIDRVAYSMLQDIDETKNTPNAFLAKIHKNSINSPLCSSMGRLFDAVCYLTTNLKEVSYDGQSGLILESLYDKNITSSYPLHVKDGVVIYDEMLLQILKDKHNPSLIASKFLNALVELIIHFATLYALPVVVCGGVFQNQTLLSTLVQKWQTSNQPLLFPQAIPPNDGGISMGQIAYYLTK